jgi:hypothetical protein
MFGISEHDLDMKILGCGDGPASFNYEMHKAGKHVVSVDPIYRFSAKQIEQRIHDTYREVIEQTSQNTDKFIWKNIVSVKELGKIRMSAMRLFLADYDKGRKQTRYVNAELPDLPFENNTFDIALSSHFLFLYTDNLSLEFHLNAIGEMCRVAKEVRIFPLLDMNAIRSPYVDQVKRIFRAKGKTISEEKVDYEFQKGGNKMLKIINDK